MAWLLAVLLIGVLGSVSVESSKTGTYLLATRDQFLQNEFVDDTLDKFLNVPFPLTATRRSGSLKMSARRRLNLACATFRVLAQQSSRALPDKLRRAGTAGRQRRDARARLLLALAHHTAAFRGSFRYAASATKNSLLEQQVLGLLENFRKLMLNGSDELPILDPLKIEHLHIDENMVNLPGAHLTVTELLVKHASTFVVDRLSITITSLIFQQYSVEFEGHIPVLDIEAGEYDLSVTAMGINVFGKGNGKVQMVNPHVSGSLTFGLWTISVSNTVIQLGLGGLKSELTGLFLHDGASDFANSFLSNLVPELVDFFQEDISALISPLIQDLVNQLLEDTSIGDLFPQLHKLSKRIGN